MFDKTQDWEIMYGVFNVEMFTFINVIRCFLFQFQVMKFLKLQNI